MTTPGGRFRVSLRVRESKAPLFKAKIPVNFWGVPLFTGCSVGHKDELSLLVGTLFDVGPSLRFAFHPNDDASPATVILKLGLGKWASANESMFSLSAEYDLGSKAPRILFRTIPRVGDFSLRRLASNGSPSPPSPSSNLGPSLPGARRGVGFDLGAESLGVSPSHASNVSSDKLGSASVSTGSTTPGADISGPRETESGPSSMLSMNATPGPSLPHHVLANNELVLAPPNPNTTASQTRGDERRSDSRESKWSLGVRSSLPFGNNMFGFLRWKLNLPSSVPLSLNVRELSFQRLPVLLLDKVSFVARAGKNQAPPSPSILPPPPSPSLVPTLSSSSFSSLPYNATPPFAPKVEYANSPYEAELSELRRDVTFLSSENESLRRAVEDFRTELNSRLTKPSNSRGSEEFPFLSPTMDDILRDKANALPRSTHSDAFKSKNPFDSSNRNGSKAAASKDSKRYSSSDRPFGNGADWKSNSKEESQPSSSINEDLRKAIEIARAAKNENNM